MKLRYFLLSLIAISLFSCKKKQEEIEPVDPRPSIIEYKTDNRTLKVSDPLPMNVDINGDGTIDLSFFTSLVSSGGGVHLYVGVNPVFGAMVRSNPNDDNRFLNMGNVIAFEQLGKIKAASQPNQNWTEDHSCMAIRHTISSVNSYESPWANGTPRILGVKLYVNKEIHYGWVRLSFNQATEELTLIDYAWNKTPDKETLAGEK